MKIKTKIKQSSARLLATGLFAMTAAVVLAYPTLEELHASMLHDPVQIVRPPVDQVTTTRPQIEVVFVLDTTGSMSGLIESAKEKIWSIASTMGSAQSAPEIKMGLVAYRDRGDAYVTRTVDLSSDLDTVYAALMDFEAAGGGDTPESVNEALFEAVHKVSWSQDDNTYRAVFLVGDAPAHMDYQDDVHYPVTIAAARKKGIVVNAVQCGQNAGARHAWNEVASLGGGEFFQVDQAGSAIAIATPFDRELADLSAELDDTRMIFGSVEVKARQAEKQRAIDKLEDEASVETLARRATFNSTDSGEANLLGSSELVEAITTGKIELSSIDDDLLPDALKPMKVAEREQVIEEKARKRDELRQKIEVLSRDRSDFLTKKVAEAGGAKESLDNRIYRAVQSQAASVGLLYEADAPSY